MRRVFKIHLSVVLLFALPCAAQAVETVYVKVLVDDEEPAVTAHWQQRLRRRVEAASAILSQYGRMRVAVLQFERWESTDGVTDFGATLTEFEQNVKPDPAHLAIGFSSQHRFGAGRHRVGGIRGPLSSHILIRESAPHVLEKERLEVLVHELGHYFGAAHSDQRTSVMRPTLGDGQARAAAFRIGFDAENGAIVRIVAGEINTFRVRRFTDISADGRRNLIAQYERLARRMPDDPTAARYIQVLRSTSVPLPRRSPGQLP